MGKVVGWRCVASLSGRRFFVQARVGRPRNDDNAWLEVGVADAETTDGRVLGMSDGATRG